jgi:DNA-binding MarR family transcriptional regulator
MGVAEEAFDRLRRVIMEGEHMERTVEVRRRIKMSPGAIRALMVLADADGVSMGELARTLGCDPSYITALVDDLGERGLARREVVPDDRRVKMVVLTEAGRDVAEELQHIMSVPPRAFSALSEPELRQLRHLLDKVLAAMRADADAGAGGNFTVGATSA